MPLNILGWFFNLIHLYSILDFLLCLREWILEFLNSFILCGLWIFKSAQKLVLNLLHFSNTLSFLLNNLCILLYTLLIEVFPLNHFLNMIIFHFLSCFIEWFLHTFTFFHINLCLKVCYIWFVFFYLFTLAFNVKVIVTFLIKHTLSPYLLYLHWLILHLVKLLPFHFNLLFFQHACLHPLNIFLLILCFYFQHFLCFLPCLLDLFH